ncbi:hypothetical protein GCM10010885_05260 [Alicyclobacillus cellulosilyticus]|uniref:Cytochrome oxidase subunit II copper A binding domain-containing protein n=1 Tax=Alicyclobacillus cellulosilyticus TaxID=1003997 RepID=A0A917K3L7_9BACL|nr:hypothetical protein [Alicyclobacillus cellulosilyticus]GGI98740.1 hypothetical protein GCM10010885_05260 [Alicyclobacillus cellulosilyticus]
MPRGGTWLALAGAAVLSAGCGAQGGGGTPADQVPKDAQVVHVTATDWKWQLDRTSVQAGRPVDFVVQSKEGTHGFSIVGTNISQAVTAGDAPVHVVWTPEHPGRYVIRCDIFCGAGHDDMFTSITVTP